MALYRKYTVPQNAPLLKKANLLEGLEAVAKTHIIKAYLVTRLKTDEMKIWKKNGESKTIMFQEVVFFVLANQISIFKNIHMNENTKMRFEAKLTN